MEGIEIIELVKNYAKDSLSLSLSKTGVKNLSEFLSWRPIDTAPKDGTDILVCDSSGDCAVANFYQGWEPSNVTTPGDRHDHPEPVLGLDMLVAWMPLPRPPAGSP